MARTDTIYLHLRKGNYMSMDVAKMAKSKDAQIRPGDVLVKVKISVPDGFFEEAVPFVQIDIPPEAAIEADVTVTVEAE